MIGTPKGEGKANGGKDIAHIPTDQCTWESVAEEESALCRHGTAVSSPCAPLCAIGAYIPASEQGLSNLHRA